MLDERVQGCTVMKHFHVRSVDIGRSVYLLLFWRVCYRPKSRAALKNFKKED